MKEHITSSLEETKQLAYQLVKHLQPYSEHAVILALKGNLGAGKTAFVKGIVEAFGNKDDVTSPTFVIQKTYPLKKQQFKNLIHIDAYRLESGEELEVLGWQESISDPQNIVCIEWPELVADVMPAYAEQINFEFIDESTRKVTFTT